MAENTAANDPVNAANVEIMRKCCCILLFPFLSITLRRQDFAVSGSAASRPEGESYARQAASKYNSSPCWS